MGTPKLVCLKSVYRCQTQPVSTPVEENVDLDSPIQLINGKSNKLYIKSKDEENKKTLMKRDHQGMIYFKTLSLKVVSATFFDL